MPTISLKISPEQKAAWWEAAEQYESVSHWIREKLDQAAAERKASRKRSGADRPKDVSHRSTRELPPERLDPHATTRPFRGMDAKDTPLRR